MNKILGDAKSIRILLGGTKFAIDYYQREYRWEKKQITELLNDLCDKFLESHEASNERSAVENYGRYFLGSIIISDKDGRKFIIDGQQRLTSLTFLLIHIYGQLDHDEQKKEIANLIFSYKLGKRSFNLDVEERTACMDALFTGQPFEENGQPESVVNILSRYQDIEGQFPDAIANEALPYFTDWLIENVYLVEITAYTDAGARMATRWSISGLTNPNATVTSSITRRTSPSTAIELADYYFCLRASTPATMTSLTATSTSTTMARTCSPRACTKRLMSMILVSGASSIEQGFPSDLIPNSRNQTWMPGKIFTESLPSRSGTQRICGGKLIHSRQLREGNKPLGQRFGKVHI